MPSFAKFIIGIPLAIVVIALYIKTTNQNSATQFTTSSFNSTSIQPNKNKNSNQLTIPSPMLKNVSFNLVGPLKCSYKDAKIDVNLLIKNKNVSVTIFQKQKEQQVRLIGDCIYFWEEKSSEGKMTCGIGQYLSLFEMFSSFISPDMISKLVPVSDSLKKDASQVNIQSLLKKCTETQIKDSIFTLPQSVKFKETKLEKQGVPASE